MKTEYQNENVISNECRIFDQGSFVRVDVSWVGVHAFRSVWPCSGLPTDKGGGFTFDKRNGDLVDLHGSFARPSADGPALVALSQDAFAVWQDSETALRSAGLHPSQNGKA